MSCQELRDARTERARIHRLASFARELVERVGQVWLNELVTCSWQAAVRREGRRASAGLREQLRIGADRAGGGRCQAEAVSRLADGVARHIRKCEFAEALVQ